MLIWLSFADKSASEKKIETIAIHEEDNLLSGFRLMDMKLFSIMMNNFACPHCLHIGLSINQTDRSRGRPEGSLFFSFYQLVGEGATPFPCVSTIWPK